MASPRTVLLPHLTACISCSQDAERDFATFALLIGALLFAYIVGDIGSLISTLDRQAALVEEKMDAVKEYVRATPHTVHRCPKRECPMQYVVTQCIVLQSLPLKGHYCACSLHFALIATTYMRCATCLVLHRVRYLLCSTYTVPMLQVCGLAWLAARPHHPHPPLL